MRFAFAARRVGHSGGRGAPVFNLEREADSHRFERGAHRKFVVREEVRRPLFVLFESGDEPQRHVRGDGQVVARPFQALPRFAALFGTYRSPLSRGA